MRQIVSTAVIRLRTLPVSQRASLAERLYEIYAERSEGASRDAFVTKIFGHDDGCLALFHGAEGELAGFLDMAVDYFEHQGRPHGVVTGGGFVRPGYRGGAICIRFALLEVLRMRLRAPRTTFSVVTRTSTPVPYRLFATLARTIYPVRGKAPPPGLESFLSQVLDRLGLTSADGTCWVVRSQALPRSTARLEELAREDPHMQFYLEKNPRFFEDRTALLIWLPLDLANIATGLFRAALAAFRQRAARPR